MVTVLPQVCAEVHVIPLQLKHRTILVEELVSKLNDMLALFLYGPV
jgi:hypothetical protein